MARYRRPRRGGGGGGFGRKLGGFTPLLAGVAENVVNNYTAGINGVGTTAVGFLLKDQFSKNLGLYQIGYSIGNFIPVIGGGGGNSGGMV